MRHVIILSAMFCMSTAIAQPPPQVLARIAGEPITMQTLREYVRLWPQLAGTLAVPVTGVKQVLNQYIEDQLLMLEGERLGLERPPQGEGGDAAYLNTLTNRLIEPCAEPTALEGRAFYDANPMQFSTPPWVRLRRLGLKYDEENHSALQAKLIQLQDEIAEGKMSFETAVATYSEDELTKNRQHGDLGFIAIDVEDPVRQLLATAPINAIVGPITDQELISLYQITARREPILSDYEAVKEKAREAAFVACRRENTRVTVEALKQRWPVEILIP